MLTLEYNARLAKAESNFQARAYEDLIRQIYTMETCNCGNLELLWMAALKYYIPGSASNIITEAELQCLFCRMGAGMENIVIPEAPPVVVTTFHADWAWVSVDPYAALFGGVDVLTYQGGGDFVSGNPIVADFRPSGINQYLVVRYDPAQSDKTTWYNDQFNYGTLPDSNFRSVFAASGYKYIVSRLALSLNPGEFTRFS